MIGFYNGKDYMKKPIFRFKIDEIYNQVQFTKGYLDSCTDNDNLFNFLSINNQVYKALKDDEKIKFIENFYKEKYQLKKQRFEKIEKEITQKIGQNYTLIIDEFARIFNVNYKGLQKYEIYLGVCPICPRFLDYFCFNLCVNDSCEENFETLLHEMTHFYWFDLFKKEYPQIDNAQYETPNLPWLVSEIVVDCILKNSKFSQFIVYPPSYGYFYDIKIDNSKLMDEVNKMYIESKNIKTFMHKVYEYIEKNKKIF